MADIVEKLFSSENGRKIYAESIRAINDFKMHEALCRGVLVGLSGGADSVMLLLLLLKYRKETSSFPILAVHVNHMIRGGEAEHDEKFSEQLCRKLGVEFTSQKIDVPMLAKKSGKSIEEAARGARYSAFADIIKSRADINTVAVAHNADDNFETVIINMMRGAGTRGMAGISPLRDNIVRPLIYVGKDDITKTLTEEKIKFVTDSTNESDDYTRNYIRHNILPEFLRAYANSRSSVEKMCKNLREDDECLTDISRKFVSEHENGKIPAKKLAELPTALLFRVLKMYYSQSSDASLERVHVEAIKNSLLKGTDFSVSLPSRISFVCRDGYCGFLYKSETEDDFPFSYYLKEDVTEISDFSSAVIIGGEDRLDYFLKIYNISTQATLSSVIIKGDLFIRNKLDGDTCFWGGMTHKLKKLFNDKKVPRSMRNQIPILCDAGGVVWVPGFGMRDDGVKNGTVCVSVFADKSAKRRFYLPSDYIDDKIKRKAKKVT